MNELLGKRTMSSAASSNDQPAHHERTMSQDTLPGHGVISAQAGQESRLREDQNSMDAKRQRVQQQAAGTASARGQVWGIDAWLASLDLHRAVAEALAPPPGQEAFSYAKTKLEGVVESRLKAAKLEGLLPLILRGIAALQTQDVATAGDLNKKFAIDGSGSIELTYGTMETFNAGLEGFIGPPFMSSESAALQKVAMPLRESATTEPTLLGQMEMEHCESPDSSEPFPSQKGKVIVRPKAQWAFVMKTHPPAGTVDEDDDGTFSITGRIRKPLSDYWTLVEEKNALLAERKNPMLVLEELVAAQLYTCPMYLKYNSVLRFFSGNRFLQDQCVKYKLGVWEGDEARQKLSWTLAPTKYATTIHAINSCIVKLSALTVAETAYRGVAGMRMPQSFFEKDPKTNLAGGVEYGFSSTTRKRETAIFYAKADKAEVASTVLEAQMGMVDRGANIDFLSQFPGEGEILYGPLMGMEVRSTRVERSTLVIVVAMSVNQKSLTLEEVVSKRRKVVMDMDANVLADFTRSLDKDEAWAALGEVCNMKSVSDYLTSVLEPLHSQGAEYYNDDAKLGGAINDAVFRANAVRGWAGGIQVRKEAGMAG